MTVMNATAVRKDWSRTIDSVIREKPAIVKRTHDCMMLTNVELMKQLLGIYKFNVTIYREKDESITLSSDDMDIAVNGETLENAKKQFLSDLVEYAQDYYDNFETWSKAPNRKAHLPYVLKILLSNSVDDLSGELVCHDGKN